MSKSGIMKRVAMACAALAVALGAGQIMQILAHPGPDTIPPAAAMGFDTQEPMLDISAITLTSAVNLPETPAATRVPIDLPTPRITPVGLEQTPVSDLPQEQSAPRFACTPQLNATPAAAAMVEIDISAPCLPNARFTLHHNGMMITEATDAAGISHLTIPALSAKPLFILAFANGEGAVASTELSAFEYYDRVVVQWQGDSGMHLHALEYQAGYDSEGHVWRMAPRDAAAAATGKGGFLTHLGADDMRDAQVAEIYTFPGALIARDGSVALSVEAEVTAQNCGRDIEAQSIQITEGGAPHVQDLTLSMPDCSATGDFLVLKNLLNDLKIAGK